MSKPDPEYILDVSGDSHVTQPVSGKAGIEARPPVPKPLPRCPGGKT